MFNIYSFNFKEKNDKKRGDFESESFSAKLVIVVTSILLGIGLTISATMILFQMFFKNITFD